MAYPLGIRELDLGSGDGAIVLEPPPSLAAAIARMVDHQTRPRRACRNETLPSMLDPADAGHVVRAAQEILVLFGARRPE